MKVLILGGTGFIGGAIIPVLIKRGHEVFALSRSENSSELLKQSGAIPVKGDIQHPEKWMDFVKTVDGIIQVAAVWGDEMGDVDRGVIEALLDTLKDETSRKKFVYTGGCWIFGATGDVVAVESSPFDPLESFGWWVSNMEIVLNSSCIQGMVIHPAMVYDRNGGVFEHIFEDAENLGHVRVVGGESIRWPLVHRDDLAELYVLLLENGSRGDVYNGSTIEGMKIGTITRTIAKRLGIHTAPVICDIETAKAEMGWWADGYVIDQQMSGQKAKRELGWRPQHLDVIADIA